MSAILSPETETKFYLLKGVEERQTDRQTDRQTERVIEGEGWEGEASATNFQNKIAAQGYIPHH
jgi:hypothetical protein